MWAPRTQRAQRAPRPGSGPPHAIRPRCDRGRSPQPTAAPRTRHQYTNPPEQGGSPAHWSTSPSAPSTASASTPDRPRSPQPAQAQEADPPGAPPQRPRPPRPANPLCQVGRRRTPPGGTRPQQRSSTPAPSTRAHSWSWPPPANHRHAGSNPQHSRSSRHCRTPRAGRPERRTSGTLGTAGSPDAQRVYHSYRCPAGVRAPPDHFSQTPPKKR